MEQKYLIFIGLIIGSMIIGACTFFAILYRPSFPVDNFLKTPVQQKSVNHEAAVCGAKDITTVTKVIDGDTVVVDGGYHVRLLGIDADEKNYPCYQAAKSRLETLVLGKQVTLQKDITDVDRYGRCLRALFLQTQNINVELAKEGLVVARFYPPDVLYQDEIIGAEKIAMENTAGCKWNQKVVN